MKPRITQKTAVGRARAVEPGTAAPLIPARPSIKRLREAARDCRACPLWKRGTQTVFGEGSREAKVVFVGERRGEFVKSPLAGNVVATVHPSSILRAPDDETRHAELARFIDDLKKIAKVIHALK